MELLAIAKYVALLWVESSQKLLEGLGVAAGTSWHGAHGFSTVHACHGTGVSLGGSARSAWVGAQF